MAFAPLADHCTSSDYVRDSIRTLHYYLNGQAKEQDAKNALTYIVSIHGNAVRENARWFWRYMVACEDEDTKQSMCHECLRRIERAVARRSGNVYIK